MSASSLQSVPRFEINFDRNARTSSMESQFQDVPVLPPVSVSMWFVALAVAALIDKGEMKFDETLSSFVPSLPNAD